MSTQIASTPEQISAFQLLALKGALKLESLGMHHSSGNRASVSARHVLNQAHKQAPRNLVKLLAVYESHLRELGILAPLKSS